MTMEEAAVTYGLPAEPKSARWMSKMARQYQIPLHLGPQNTKRISRVNFERLLTCLQVQDGQSDETVGDTANAVAVVLAGQSERSKSRRRKAESE